MRLIFIKFLLILQLSLTICNSYGQKIRQENFSIENGLPSPETYFAVQDSKGYYWFGTDHGVCIYDGYGFTTYDTDNSGLTCNTVFKCFESPTGELWFLCYDKTISIFRHSSSSFEPFVYNDSIAASFKYWPEKVTFNKEIVQIFGTNSKYGYLEYNQKLERISYQPYSLVTFDTILGPNNETVASTFYISRDLNNLNEPLILSNCFDCIDEEIHRNGKWPYNTTVSNKDTVYFYVHNDLYFFANHQVTLQKTFKENINHIYFDKHDRLFVLTTDGCCILNKDRSYWLLKSHNLSGMLVDRDHNYWFSDLEKGLFKLPNIFIESFSYSSLENNNVTALKSFGNGLLIGTNQEEIFHLDQNYQLSQLVSKYSDLSKNLSIEHFTRIQKGVLSTGCFEITLKDEIPKITKIPTASYTSSTLQLEFNKYISLPYSNGYVIHTNKSWSEIVPTNGERITSLVRFNNKIYFTSLRGLWETKINEINSPQKLDDDTLINGRLNKVISYNNKFLIILSAGKGLIFKTSDYTFQLNEKNGLVGNNVNCMALSDSILWVGTNQGISKIVLYNDPRKAQVLSTLTTQDGLLSNFIYSLEKWDNHICVGSDKGFFKIPLAEFNHEIPSPILNIISLTTNNNKVKAANTFSYDDNNFRINYIGISTKKFEGECYRYTVKYNGEWQPERFTSNTNIDFINMSSGKYQIKIECRNRNNKWSQPQFVNLEIMPHFTNELWFIISIWLLSLTLIVLGISWRNNISKSRAAKEKALVQMKLKFKESELSSLKSNMNPHFIFNALNSIRSLIRDKDIKSAEDYLLKFSDLMRKSFEYTRGNWITISEEISFLRNYVQVEQLRFQKGVKLSVFSSENKILNQYSIPPMLLQPLIENSFKHGFIGNENYELSIHFELMQDFVRFTIVDNGIGIGNKKKVTNENHHSLGLKIIKERLELLTTYNYQPDFVFMDLSEINPKLKGTKVIIDVPFEM